jgi:tetrahydromethanopterin S-methyltransferase subunit G
MVKQTWNDRIEKRMKKSEKKMEELKKRIAEVEKKYGKIEFTTAEEYKNEE